MIVRPLIEMANLRKEETGIPGFVIYISQRQGLHGPRVKVYLSNRVGEKYQSANYSISNNPERKSGKLKLNSTYDLMVKSWIKLNLEYLLYLWYTEETIYIRDILDSIKRIEK